MWDSVSASQTLRELLIVVLSIVGRKANPHPDTWQSW